MISPNADGAQLGPSGWDEAAPKRSPSSAPQPPPRSAALRSPAFWGPSSPPPGRPHGPRCRRPAHGRPGGAAAARGTGVVVHLLGGAANLPGARAPPAARTAAPETAAPERGYLLSQRQAARSRSKGKRRRIAAITYLYRALPPLFRLRGLGRSLPSRRPARSVGTNGAAGAQTKRPWPALVAGGASVVAPGEKRKERAGSDASPAAPAAGSSAWVSRAHRAPRGTQSRGLTTRSPKDVGSNASFAGRCLGSCTRQTTKTFK